MDSQSLDNLRSLSASQKAALKRANIRTVQELFLEASRHAAKRRKGLSLDDANRMLDLVSGELAQEPRLLKDVVHHGGDMFTTGDASFDEALAGGVRTRMLWEVFGESAAGKSQLALQLSLMVQLPTEMCGLSGSACFLTTTGTLPTSRLKEMLNAHPQAAPGHCSLSDIHTIQAPDVASLLEVLSLRLPAFIQQVTSRPQAKPVRLLIIDALTELFHSEGKTTTSYLIQRSKDLVQISAQLHALARKHDMAVLVVNEVADAFARAADADAGAPGELLFHDQARLFASASSVPGESRKQASLGLVWANQLNARIMLSRTERTRYLDNGERRRKRPRLDDGCAPGPTRIRRLSILFHCAAAAAPAHMDYIITDAGFVVVPDEAPPCAEIQPHLVRESPPVEASVADLTAYSQGSAHGITPFDFGAIDDEPAVAPDGTFVGEDELQVGAVGAENGPIEEDEWEKYWKDSDTQDLGYSDFDFEPPPASSDHN